MLLVICDGGSSKADWKIFSDGDNILSVTTKGFNPNYDSKDKIAAILSKELVPSLDPLLEASIHYYGAGCWDSVRKNHVAKAMTGIYPKAHVEIQHDLLAAARATCGTEPGIACILGTGSNSVLYDGHDEVDNVTNLGFLLGDEGSGSQIGKRLVQAYFYREMPVELHPIMEKVCPNGKRDILDKVYDGSVPAAYLATFAGLFNDHKEHPFVKGIVASCFDEFIKRHVCKYEGHEHLPVHFVGSIAYFFQGILKEVLVENNLQVGNILRKPIFNLLKYHLQHQDGISLQLDKLEEALQGN